MTHRAPYPAEALADLGLPPDRPFTVRQAGAVGTSRLVLAQLVDDGLLRRQLRGVYLATAAGDSLLLRAKGLGLVMTPDAVICDEHAGWLHGASMVLAPGEHLALSPVSVFRPSDAGRLKSGLARSGERNLRPGDVTEVHGLRVTTPLRTAWDLGRVRHPDRAIAAMDQMHRLGAFTRGELLAGVGRFAGMRWVRTLRAVAPYVDGRAESPPESILRLRCLESGMPSMTPQLEVTLAEGWRYRLDLGNEELRLAIEYDGEDFHSSPDQRRYDAHRRRALADEGWVIVVVRQANLFGHDQDVELLLRAGLREARRRGGERLTDHRR